MDKSFHGLEPTPQGKLIISFVPITNYACINALELSDESRWTMQSVLEAARQTKA